MSVGAALDRVQVQAASERAGDRAYAVGLGRVHVLPRAGGDRGGAPDVPGDAVAAGPGGALLGGADCGALGGLRGDEPAAGSRQRGLLGQDSVRVAREHAGERLDDGGVAWLLDAGPVSSGVVFARAAALADPAGGAGVPGAEALDA